MDPSPSSSTPHSHDQDILHDLTPLLRHYKDGRIERLLGTDTVPASLYPDPTTGVQSKDVQIAPHLPLSARLYLPKTAVPGKKLPLLIYFHGGGFVIESAFSPLYHKHLNTLTKEANVVGVSVEYRLAPESPIPAAFEDAWEALKWTASNSTDEWIKNYADLSRVYLGGDSAGANIAHNTAVRFGTEKLQERNNNYQVKGMFLNCPFFWGKYPIGRECDEEVAQEKILADELWYYACPGLSVLDEPWINPSMDEKLGELGCWRVLVYMGEKDLFKDRGWLYKEAMEGSGWQGELEVIEVEGEDHVFSVLNPDGQNSQQFFNKVASFVSQD